MRAGAPGMVRTLGYLSGKALRTHLDGDHRKALHYTTSSAPLLHWHAAVLEESGGAAEGLC